MTLRGAVYVNGKITPPHEAVVPVYDHGFVYGEGVYETLRTYNRTPFLYDRHMARLRASAERIRLDVPFSNDTLSGWIADTIGAAGDLREAYIRVLLTRGVGELNYDPRTTPTPTVVIIVKPLDEQPARILEQGIAVSLVPILRNHPESVDPVIKANNLLNNALAMQEALRRGGEEALMCNYRGEIAECSQSNFFIVRGNALLTPPTQSGLLEGITRAYFLEIGREIGLDAREQVLYPSDLDSAQEAFITSTTRELSPVVRVDDKPVGTGTVGPISRQLLDEYRKRAWATPAGRQA